MIVGEKIISIVIKAISKKFKLSKVLSYVEDDNELDEKCRHLEKRIELLEKMAHPKRDFVRCKQCEERIDNANKLMQSVGDEPI